MDASHVRWTGTPATVRTRRAPGASSASGEPRPGHSGKSGAGARALTLRKRRIPDRARGRSVAPMPSTRLRPALAVAATLLSTFGAASAQGAVHGLTVVT